MRIRSTAEAIVRRARGGRMLRYGAAAAVGAAVAGAVSFAIAEVRQTSKSDGTPILSVRPTGVGLPLVGAHGTIGAGDYAPALKDYHRSGDYRADLGEVGRRARRTLARRVRKLRKRGRVCKSERRSCRKPRPALVLDIDDTSLSNYSKLAPTDFKNAVAGLATAIAAADSPPIGPTLRLFDAARKRNVAVFFITGRPEHPTVRDRTEANLRGAGYEDWAGLVLNESGEEVVDYKSGARAEIEDDGYRIVANVGDQETDLEGGHADRAFKYPNPFYIIGP